MESALEFPVRSPDYAFERRWTTAAAKRDQQRPRVSRSALWYLPDGRRISRAGYGLGHAVRRTPWLPRTHRLYRSEATLLRAGRHQSNSGYPARKSDDRTLALDPGTRGCPVLKRTDVAATDGAGVLRCPRFHSGRSTERWSQPANYTLSYPHRRRDLQESKVSSAIGAGYGRDSGGTARDGGDPVNPNPDPAAHKKIPLFNTETWFYEDFEIGGRIRSIGRTLSEGECGSSTRWCSIASVRGR